MRQFLPISALLLGSFFLLFAGGVNSLILPVRGSAEGFSALSLGLLGTGWAIGYVSGCLYTARLVRRVGHVRAFSTLCSLAGIVILLQLVLLSSHVWIPLRALQGFCFAGAAMIVESWLSERSEAASRGRIFGIYTMVNLTASTAGQLTLTLGDTNGYFFFVIGAIFYMLAVIPTAASSTQSPQPLVSVRLDLKALWRNSPVAVFAVFMVGISNSSFGTLAAVYADRIGLAVSSVAIFASVPILIGAISQMPVGYLSDRMDRRKVLIGVAALALTADALFVFLAPQSEWANLALAGLFGGAIFAMYPIIIAHANDQADGNFIRISGGLLLVYGLGAIAGPLIAGWAMSTAGERGLFMTTAGAHILMISQALWRISRRASIATDDKTDFQPGPAGRATTPQTIALSASEAEVSEAMAEALDAEETP